VTFSFQRTRREPTQTSVLLETVKREPGKTASYYAHITALPLNTVRDALYRAVCRGQLKAVTWTAESDADRPRRGRPPLCYWPVESTEGVTGG
jgi:predicted ArsR family transcriptional regulator